MFHFAVYKFSICWKHYFEIEFKLCEVNPNTLIKIPLTALLLHYCLADYIGENEEEGINFGPFSTSTCRNVDFRLSFSFFLVFSNCSYKQFIFFSTVYPISWGKQYIKAEVSHKIFKLCFWKLKRPNGRDVFSIF